MATNKTCDVCGQPTNRIAAKLLIVPVTNGSDKKWKTGNYTAHSDVGECCIEKLLKGEIVKWTTRKKRPAKAA